MRVLRQSESGDRRSTFLLPRTPERYSFAVTQVVRLGTRTRRIPIDRAPNSRKATRSDIVARFLVFLLETILSTAILIFPPNVSVAAEGGHASDDVRPPNISERHFNVRGRSHFHATLRLSPSTEERLFSDDLRTSLLLQGAIQVAGGSAVTFGIPFGLISPTPGDDHFVFGNVKIGGLFGHTFFLGASSAGAGPGPRIALGGALEIYLPTQTYGGAQLNGLLEAGLQSATSAAIRNMYGNEPELFIDKSVLFRTRGHFEVEVGPLIGEAELSLTPGFQFDPEVETLFLLGWSVALRARPLYVLEVFVESGSAFHIVGKRSPALDLTGQTLDPGLDVTTPVLATLGVRFHTHLGVDPALFGSVDLRDGFFIFGVDIAGVLQRSSYESREGNDFLSF